jgi:putative ABC transport system permease protein
VLAILISVIGILGLILITINQNMKELAVRKALGANIRETARLISRSLVWPFIIASASAVPLSCFGLKNWLFNNYVHHIALSYDIFLLPVLLILLVILCLVFLLSRKINKINISEVLQYE